MITQVVLHTEYGGFHISDEMALWLEENRGWRIIKYKDREKYSSDPDQNRILVEYPGSLRSLSTYNYEYQDSFEFRSNQDLIDCVLELQKKYEDLPWGKRDYVDNLSIKKIRVNIEIEDYHDGHERIHCQVIESYND